VFTEDKVIADAAVATGYFIYIEGSDVVTPSATPTGTITKLDVMTVAQLKEYAKEKGIDLSKAAKKEDIIDVIIAAEVGESDGDNGDPVNQFVDNSADNASE